MIKISLTFLTLSLLLFSSSALFKHQAGQFDWDIKALGDVEKVEFFQDRAGFISKDGYIGVFSANSGKLDWTKQLSKEHCTAGFGVHSIFVFDKRDRTISFYSFDYGIKNSVDRFEELANEEAILDVIMQKPIEGGEIVTTILAKKYIYIYRGISLQGKKDNTYAISTIRMSNAGKIYGVSENNFEICVFDLSAFSPIKKCINKNDNGKITDISIHDDVITLRSAARLRILNLKSFKEASEAIKADTKTTYIDGCHLLAIQNGDEAKLYDIQGESLKLVNTLPVTEKTGFSCSVLEGQKKFLLQADVAGSSTLKVKRYNLNAPEEAPVILFDQILDFEISAIVEIFYGFGNNQARLVIKTETLQLIAIEDRKFSWRNEESLSKITEVQFFDYESLGVKEINPYFEHLDEHSDRLVDLVPNFVRRVTTQVQKFTEFAQKTSKTLSNFNLKQLLQTDDVFERKNGLQKILIAITQTGTVYGLDSKTGKIFWQKTFDPSWTLVNVYKAKTNSLSKDAVIYMKNENLNKSKLIHLDPLDGREVEVEEFDKIPQELILLQLHKITGFALVFDENDVKLYPKNLNKNEISEHLKDLSVYKISKTGVTGYKVFGNALVPAWNLNLPEKEEVLQSSHWQYDPAETAFKTIVPEDRKVIYKFSDSNNFAILAKSSHGQPHLVLYIVNGVTGRVLNTRPQFDVDFNEPINLLFDENTVFVSYFNTKNLFFEIWVTELYKSELESSFTNLLERYFFEKLTTDEEAKYNNIEPGYIVFTQKFYFSPGVQLMGVVETIHGVSRKNLVVVTTNGQLYSIDRGLLSTRRPVAQEGKTLEIDPKSYLSSEFPPYVSALQISGQKYITYYKKFHGLKHIEASPTRFESTSLLFAYGHDIVYARTAPEKEFDMLSGDFKYELLLGSIAIITVALVVVKKLTKKHKLNKIFLNA